MVCLPPLVAPGMVDPRYDVLDVRYGDGGPAILRHVDGTGFAYYSSGRKAICASPYGGDAKTRARRFAAIIHGDSSRSPVLGLFDEWGRGFADCMPGPNDARPPKVVIAEHVLTMLDGNGDTASQHPIRSKGSMLGSTDRPEISARLNACVTLRHRLGRTFLEFLCEGVSHTFLVGELHGDEVEGMPPPQPLALPPISSQDLQGAHQRLATVTSMRETCRADPSQKGAKPRAPHVTLLSSVRDLASTLENLQANLMHPNLAPTNLQWNTERRLKKLLSDAHPQCPATVDAGPPRKAWSIAQVSGKCTYERLANTKPTVAAPTTVTQISQLKLPRLIEECASKNALLVVICLATYAREQSEFARLAAEKAQTEILIKLGSRTGTGAALMASDDSGGSSPPVRFVQVELSEIAGFAEQYKIKEVPYCLMFRDGHVVHSKRLSGVRIGIRAEGLIRPQVLLVEPDPGIQFKLERALRRGGYSSDLALDGPQALRLAGRQQQPYGAVLLSSSLRVNDARGIVSAVKRNEARAMVVVYNTSAPAEEEPDARRRFFEECDHTFPSLPSYTGLATVLIRCSGGSLIPINGAKQELVNEVLAALGSTGGGNAAATLRPEALAAAT